VNDDVIYVPRGTRTWRVPILNPITHNDWDYIDISRPEKIDYEDVQLNIDYMTGIVSGYSIVLHKRIVWEPLA